MTTRTLYVPVLIETAAQAEALPVGTVGLPNPSDGCRAPYLKTEDGWVSGWYPDWKRDGTQDVVADAAMVGDQALVPVEAEEERVERIEYSPRGYEADVYSETRLVTEWRR